MWRKALSKSLTSINTVGVINTQLVYRRAVHHSLGYATLFGCYEAIRRTLVVHSFFRLAAHDNKDDKIDSNSSNSNSHDALADNIIPWECSSSSSSSSFNIGNSSSTIEAAPPVVASFVAGGLAGQAHYCMSYYTRHWKWQHSHIHSKQQHAAHATAPPPPVSFPMAVVTRKIPLPQSQAIRGAFIPTAITFVAFQYGGQVFAKIMANIDNDDNDS
jgi:hypothetical protein